MLAGYPVDLTVLDAMPAAVEAAQQAAEKVRHVEASVTPLVADVRSLDDVPSDHFDAVRVHFSKADLNRRAAVEKK